MAKQLLFKSQSRRSLIKGIKKLYNAVRVTMGSKGRNVVIQSGEFPMVTKDGVTVADAVILADPYENTGAQLMKQVSKKTEKITGDGTTTATVLAYAIIREGLKAVSMGIAPVALQRGITKAVSRVVLEIKEQAKPLILKSDVKNVATVSANGSIEIGEHIADAIEKVTTNGVISIEESKTGKTTIDIVMGMEWENGWLSKFFCEDYKTPTIKKEDVLILVAEYKITRMADLMPSLEIAKRENKSLLIIAEEIEGEAIQALAINSANGSLDVCAVKTPGYGNRRKALIQDIAILTGAELISPDAGLKLANVKAEQLGYARNITVTDKSTTIVAGDETKQDIKDRAEEIQALIDESVEFSYEEKILKERLGKLVGGVALINVGATTDAELKEVKSRYIDAKHATLSGIKEGIVSGGGTVLAQIANKLKKEDMSKMTKEDKAGLKIVIKALQEPCRQIANNAGANGSRVVKKVMKSPLKTGFNASTLEYVDMLQAGILDPAKVTRVAVENASSIAGLILTTECAIVDIPEGKKESKPRGIMGM